MIDYVEQCWKTAVMVKATLHVREESAQRRSSVRVIRRTTRVEIVNTDLFSLVCVPTWLSKERRHVTLRAVCLAVEDHFSTRSRCAIETAFGRRRWRDRQLVELKRGQFRGHHVNIATLVPESCACCDRVLYRVVQARVEEGSLPLQFEVSDESVPVSNPTPASAPRMQINPSLSEGRRYEHGSGLAVRAKCLAVEIQLRVKLSWSPTGKHFLDRRFIDSQQRCERTEIWGQRHDG